MRAPLAKISIVSLLVIAGCGSDDSSSGGGSSSYGGSSGGSSKPASSDAVDIKDFKYGPAAIEVAKGTTVSFTNDDSAKHTATSKPQGAFDSGDITKGQTKAVTFKKAGTFNYFCVYHPTMAGKVTVK